MSHECPRRAELAARKRQKLIADLQAVAAEFGPHVTLNRFVLEVGISHRPVYYWFGNWRQLRIEAGLPPQIDRRLHLNTWSRDHLLDAMQLAVARHGQRLSQQTFCREAGLSPGPIKRLFGGWSGLRQAVGLDPTTPPASQPRYSQDELAQALRELVEREGSVTIDAFCRHLGVSRQTVYREGNWTTLHAAAGLPYPRPRRTREGLLSEIRRLVNELGDVSLSRFCYELKISAATVDRLGPWQELRRELKLPAKACTGRPLWLTQMIGEMWDPQTALCSPDLAFFPATPLQYEESQQETRKVLFGCQ